MLAHASEIIVELRLLKKEKGVVRRKDGVRTKVRDRRKELDFAFLFVVDIVRQKSHLLICGGRELALAKKAFPHCPLSAAQENISPPGNTATPEETLMDMPEGWVSRKAQ